ncbi:ribosome rescue protein RqcH [Methanocaldococcus indicus]|uniref:ribosome rescue protein RqcH n=1 Tax=Methanocaldococcus indicus TaxID=213231 RepID=UPI003C6DAC58
MKTELTNVDISAIVDELKFIENGRVDKAFLISNEENKELILKIHIPERGSRELVISVGKYKYITLTNYEREKPKLPPSFAMLLRKYLSNAKIEKIYQYSFDRIIVIEFRKVSKYKLIVELFKEGNIIFTDENNNIIVPLKVEKWSTRIIAPKHEYKFPEQRPLTPYNLDYSIAYEIFRDYFLENKDVECVRLVSRLLGLAGLYAEEICERAKIDKKKKNLTEDEIKNLFLAVKNFFNDVFNNREPKIILKDNQFIDVTPINLLKYKDYDKKDYENFIEAVDDYFANFLALKKITKVKSKVEKEIEKQESILKRQLRTLEEYKKESEKNRIKGDLIYANYQLIEELLNAINLAREKKSWEEIKKIIKENKNHPILGIIEDIRENKGELIVRLKYEDVEERVVLDIRKNAFENAESYYEKAKKLKNKLKGIEEAIERTKKKIEELKKKRDEEIEEKKPKKKKRRERKWYEKFKWTVIDNFLIIAGKDAITNEIIIKKYTNKDDIVFHADITGAPFTVIKTNGREVKEETLLEVAKFAASHSKAWKLGYGAIDVYYVKPEQISKQAESGEYLKRGAFMIRGKRNYIRNVPLELGVGVLEYDGEIKITTAPKRTLEERFLKYVMLKPSNKEKGKVVKELKNIFKEYDLDDEEILSVLPPGGCEIVK